MTIRTRKGRRARINTSRRAACSNDQRFEVLVSKGMLQRGNRRPSEAVKSDADGAHADTPEHFLPRRYRDAYRLERAHFFDCS